MGVGVFGLQEDSFARISPKFQGVGWREFTVLSSFCLWSLLTTRFKEASGVASQRARTENLTQQSTFNVESESLDAPKP